MTNDDIKTCDKCQHYTHDDGRLQGFENCGSCILMGDWNGGDMAVDRCAGWDYEGYSAGVYVGPKFGCLHWQERTQCNDSN